MARYVVTGGAGFIGSHVVDALLRRGENVHVIDNLMTGYKENLASAMDHIAFTEADIRDFPAIRPCFDGADYAIHLAALPSVPRSISDPVTSNAVNVDGTLNVLVAAREAKLKRLVFASSSSIYGDYPELPRVESQPPRPLSPYALTKLTGEYYCRIFTRIYGLETVSLRFFNIFGPRQDPNSPYSGVLSVFAAFFLRNTTPTIFGDGEQSRDFTFVDNAVDAVLRAAATSGLAGEALNVGIGERHTLNETVGLLNKILKRQLAPSYGEARAGDVKHSHADITRARQLLRYEPSVGFEDGLRKTLEGFRDSRGSR